MTTAPAEAPVDPPEVDPTPDNLLVAALAAAQSAFPKIERRNTATVQGKNGATGYSYTYADLGDVLAAVRPVLGAFGLAIVQRTVRQANGVVLLTELKHVGGGELVSEVDVGQSSSNPQQFGGALTYLRRYELVTLLGIAAEEDRDAQDVEPHRNGNAPAEPEPWARASSKARVEAMVKALEPIIGRPRGIGLATSIRESLGHVPDVAVGTAIAIAAAVVEELDPLAFDVARDRRATEAAEAKAKAEEVARQEAAEAPDEPGPTGEEEDPPTPPEGTEPTPEPEEDPPDDVGQTDGPAAGSVPAPERTGNVDDDVAAYRAAGCICGQPLTDPTRVGAHFDTACPIVNHGIGF